MGRGARSVPCIYLFRLYVLSDCFHCSYRNSDARQILIGARFAPSSKSKVLHRMHTKVCILARSTLLAGRD